MSVSLFLFSLQHRRREENRVTNLPNTNRMMSRHGYMHCFSLEVGVCVLVTSIMLLVHPVESERSCVPSDLLAPCSCLFNTSVISFSSYALDDGGTKKRKKSKTRERETDVMMSSIDKGSEGEDRPFFRHSRVSTAMSESKFGVIHLKSTGEKSDRSACDDCTST